jgi:cell division control protein 45
MDLGLRTEVGTLFEEKASKYSIEDITYGSFTANFGFRHKLCAADVVYACLAIMESHQDAIGGKSGLVFVAKYTLQM